MAALVSFLSIGWSHLGGNRNTHVQALGENIEDAELKLQIKFPAVSDNLLKK